MIFTAVAVQARAARFQRRFEAMRAPSASEASLAQTIEGTTTFFGPAKLAKPRSVPPIARSRPTIRA